MEIQITNALYTDYIMSIFENDNIRRTFCQLKKLTDKTTHRELNKKIFLEKTLKNE